MGRKNSMTSSAPTPSPNVDEVQQEMAVGRSASARIRDRASLREGYGDGDSGRPAHWRTAPHRRRSSSLLPSSSYSLGQPKRMIIGSGFSIRRQMLANIQRFICSVIQIQGDQRKNVLIFQYFEIHFLAVQFDKCNSLPFCIHVESYINGNFMSYDFEIYRTDSFEWYNSIGNLFNDEKHRYQQLISMVKSNSNKKVKLPSTILVDQPYKHHTWIRKPLRRSVYP
uniref:Uncharacterized protein n=1 Tax=Oryza glumipatula TaxID=40148 RepID=A0A0D9Y884_9ORYZ